MKKKLSILIITALIASSTFSHAWPTVPPFSLQEGIQKTWDSKTGKYTAGLTLLAVISSGLLIAHNNYLMERLGSEDFGDSNWLERLQGRLAVIPEIFDQDAWLSAPFRHIPFRTTLGASILGCATLAGLSIYNGFKKAA